MLQSIRAAVIVVLLFSCTGHNVATQKFVCVEDLTIERMDNWSGNVKYKLSRQLTSDFSNWVIEIHFDQPVSVLEQWIGILDKSLHVIHEEERVFFIKPKQISSKMQRQLNIEMIAQYNGVVEPKIRQAALCGDTSISASYPTKAPLTQVFPTFPVIGGTTPKCEVKEQTWNTGMKGEVKIPIVKDIHGWVIELKFSAPWKKFYQYSCKIISANANTYMCNNLNYNGYQRKDSVMNFAYQIDYSSEKAKLEEVWFNTGYHCKVY